MPATLILLILLLEYSILKLHRTPGAQVKLDMYNLMVERVFPDKGLQLLIGFSEAHLFERIRFLRAELCKEVSTDEDWETCLADLKQQYLDELDEEAREDKEMEEPDEDGTDDSASPSEDDTPSE